MWMPCSPFPSRLPSPLEVAGNLLHSFVPLRTPERRVDLAICADTVVTGLEIPVAISAGGYLAMRAEAVEQVDVLVGSLSLLHRPRVKIMRISKASRIRLRQELTALISSKLRYRVSGEEGLGTGSARQPQSINRKRRLQSVLSLT